MTTRVVEVPRKRHRGRRAVIAIIVVIVILVVAFFTADYFARSYATSYVQQRIATALGQSSTKSVSVNLGSGSILIQAATGSIHDVTVDVDPLVIDGLAGTGTLTAHGVPLSSTTPVEQLQVDITIPQTTLTEAITRVPSLAQFEPKVTIVGQHVTVTGTISIFGFEQHIGVTLEPQVSAGVPSLKILTATFNGATISVTQLDKYVPGLSDALRSTTSLCIADQLPKSFELTGVALQDQSIVSTFTGNGVELNEASLTARGTC
jgi:LmeA-like phospholipid-binding